MKNWETKEFADDFDNAMNCPECPAHKTCKITACEMMAQKKIAYVHLSNMQCRNINLL